MIDLENLRTVAEVAIAVAGFSGVAVALRPAEGRWTGREFYQFRLLLIQSVMVVMFAFLPGLLQQANLTEIVISRTSNLLLGAAEFSLCVYIYRGYRSATQEGSTPRWLLATLVTGCTIASFQLAHALGALPSLGSALFLLCLLYILSMSLLTFVLMLLGQAGREGGRV